MPVVLGGVDFGHLHRFKVSLGLALVVASVGLPWLVFRDNTAVSFTRAQISALTPTGQRVVEHKQSTYELLLYASPFVSAALLVGGLALLWWGLSGWNAIQGLLDRKERAEVAIQEHEVSVRIQTETERLLTTVHEAEEDGALAEKDPRAALTGQASSTTALKSRVQDALRIESSTIGRIAEAFAGTHESKEHLVVRTDRGIQASADLVLEPHDPLDKVIVCEIQSVSSERAFTRGASNRFASLALFAEIYRNYQYAEIRAVVLVVFDFKNSLQVSSNLTTLDRIRQRIDGYMEVYPGVYGVVTDERTLTDAPLQDLRLALGTGQGGVLQPFGGQLVLPLDWTKGSRDPVLTGSVWGEASSNSRTQ